MANILLGVTGSVAAIRTPELHEALQRAGHRVKVVATRPSLYFFDPASLLPSGGRKPPESGVRSQESGIRNQEAGTIDKCFFVDEDEWPGGRYQREDPVLHIELRRWADLFLIAPCDANTLAKLANGLCDNCLTCVWRAWDPGRPVVLAPAMNTLMWENPLTARHFRQLTADGGAGIPMPLDQDGVVEWLNREEKKLRVAPPVSKRLACGDVGVGAMAALEEILAMVDTLVHAEFP